MSTIDLANMSETELAQFVAEARRRKQEKVRSTKFAKFEPTYSDYRKSLVEKKKATDLSKSLLADLKKLGFGVKTPKVTTTPATPSTKGTKKK